MKTVFNSIHDVSKLFIAQTQDFAGTPLTYIKGQGKGRRFYFKGDTIYSYRDSYPLARIIGDTIYVRYNCYSRTTTKHKNSIIFTSTSKNFIYSNDLKNPICIDFDIEKRLKKLINMRKYINIHKDLLKKILNDVNYPITKSKFPLFFNKKHDKLKQMFFSNDVETFNLAKQIIKQEKLI